jgi:hypothetical protein
MNVQIGLYQLPDKNNGKFNIDVFFLTSAIAEYQSIPKLPAL